MAAAHVSAVLHRDLKPDNILVGKAGRIAVTDFGIARLAQTPLGTAEGFIGTPAYMAPEQVEGRDVTTASDVYALGAILFELLTGRRPWLGDDSFAVAIARLREPPPDPRSVPDALAELALRCLAREPEGRPAGALARALAAIGEVDMTARQVFVAVVPEKAARAVAILPMRGTGELAEVAEGLSEEIVDALSMTKALRVRPLASVRAATKAEADARELGAQLGVDVVVDSSIHIRGPQIRITARAIGVADGFQLWASHFDCGPDGLLAAGDELVKAIANALIVDLAMPARGILDAKIAGRYLEAKARLRAAWHDGRVHEAIHILEPLLLEASDDPRILATLAIALARSAFYAIGPDLPRARLLADKALSVAPDFGEAQFARALVHLYESDVPAAAAMLRRTVTTVPGFSLAQGLLGALLLEAGSLDEALLHLEAARSIDPTASQMPNLARAYAYLGRHDDAIATLNAGGKIDVLSLTSIGRFQMWRGEIRPYQSEIPPVLDALTAGTRGCARPAPSSLPSTCASPAVLTTRSIWSRSASTPASRTRCGSSGARRCSRYVHCRDFAHSLRLCQSAHRRSSRRSSRRDRGGGARNRRARSSADILSHESRAICGSRQTEFRRVTARFRRLRLSMQMEVTMTRDPEAIALAYLDAVSTKELDRLEALVSPQVRFVGPAATMTGRDDVVAALRRISAVHVRNEVRRVFSDRDEVCVIYDLITDTIGALPTIEWLKIADGRIQSINLYYDQLPWQRVREELARRAKASA